MSMIGHNSHAETLREAARFILACDQEVADVNERKKDFFKELRGQLPDEYIKALKSAIKVYRERARDLEASEAHDSRVWEVLSIIEGQNHLEGAERAVRALQGPSTAIPEKPAPTRTRASREAVKKQAMRHSMEDHVELSEKLASLGMISPEAAEENRMIAEAMNRKFGDGQPLEVVDLETGELTDPHSAADPAAVTDSADDPPAHDGGVPPAPPSPIDDAGPIPPFLDRRAKAEARA